MITRRTTVREAGEKICCDEAKSQNSTHLRMGYCAWLFWLTKKMWKIGVQNYIRKHRYEENDVILRIPTINTIVPYNSFFNIRFPLYLLQ